jgi:hypothetical protein
MMDELNRRRFMGRTAALGGAATLGGLWAGASCASQPGALQPIGQPQGLHPGRVVWVHDPQVTDWEGPGQGHWYRDNHTSQDRVDGMLARAVCDLTGEGTVPQAWDQLFRYFHGVRAQGDVGYRPGEKIVIKPNWVGMIWREGSVDPETYTLVKRQDYMNTAPQMIIALLRQLVGNVGVLESDITVCDSLAYLVHEYYEILHGEFPNVRYVDYAGRFGRIQVQPSAQPLSWSCRPEGVAPDFVPQCYADATYLINFANLKAHTAAGVTLCAKNHFGSLVRWPVQQGYYDMHHASFSKATGVYREQVDLMGHRQLGGKTVLYLIDGLFSGKHPIDHVPQRWQSPPFDGHWTCSLLASQDPVAIDSVGLDFLRAEWDDHPQRPAAEDYLHEAALADQPPSGTFYDPDHPTPERRLPSLGVHEHWNNPRDKQYSRNLGIGEGIELVPARIG